MNRLTLNLPTEADEQAAMRYHADHLTHGETRTHGAGGLFEHPYAEWLKRVLDGLRPETVPQGLVPATTFFAKRIGEDEIIGTIQIRHALNDHLLHFGGHIGYAVRPTERRMGYASEMLALALRHCADVLLLGRVLLTCDKCNEASARTIQRCGGVLENEVVQPDGTLLQRYWIEFNK